MLNFLRKRATSWFIKIALGLIIIVFVLWGVGTMRQKEQMSIGEVNGIKISLIEFQNAVNMLTENYKAILGDKFDYKVFSEQIKKNAWDLVVQQTLLLQKAEDLKIKVSPKEILDEIQKTETFKDKGVFSRERYIEVLRFNKMTPSVYEAQIEKALILKKVRTFLKNAITANNDEIAQWYVLKNRKIKAGYVTLDYKDFVKEVKVNGEELKKFYDANKEQFKKPEEAKISYVIVPFESFKGEIKPAEQDLKEYYDEHKDEFFEPKQYLLRHVFVSFGKDKEKARNTINEAYKKVGKENISKVASKYNEDGTKTKGGLLGYVNINMLSPKIAEKIAPMKKGDISGIVESEYGYHIFKLEDIKEERTKSFDEVKRLLIDKVIEKKAKLIAIKKASEIKDLLEKGQTVTDPKFKIQKASVSKTKPFLKDRALPEVVNTIFSVNEGKIFGPIILSKDIIVGKVEKIEKGYFSLSEKEKEIKEMVIKNKAFDRAEEKAKAIIASTNIPKGKVTDWFSPVVNIPAPLSNLKGLEKDIPSLTKENKILKSPYRSDESVYIVYLEDIQEPTWDPQSDDAKKFTIDFIENKQNNFFEEWLKNAKESAKIKLYEENFKNM